MAVIVKNGKADVLVNTTNGAKDQIEIGLPYSTEITVQGTCPLLWHCWNVEAIEEQANAAKGSKVKKSDNVESFIRRNEAGVISIPGDYFRQSLINAARYRQDPRSPRKSMMDLTKAAIASLEEYAPITSASGEVAKTWDYLDRRRVMVQRQGITRSRPAFHAGWQATFSLQVSQPEYISSTTLNELVQLAGKFIGLADNRPSYGRFQIIRFEVLDI